jgi:hypothetical protein
MTFHVEACSVLAPIPVVLLGPALSDFDATAGLAVAAVVGWGLFFRWLMAREDRRQTFQEKQAEARDALLNAQAEQLREQTALLRVIAERLGVNAQRLDAIEKKCHGAHRPASETGNASG